MGVNVGTLPVVAFGAIILAVVLVIAALMARRRGHLQNRGLLIAIAVVVVLLIAFGMTGGFVPKL